MKNNMVFLAGAAAVLIVLLFLSSGRKIPPIPVDDLHRNITADSVCRECHAPGKGAPLKDSHPPKEQCLVCHKTKR
jgi:hypothetical protein